MAFKKLFRFLSIFLAWLSLGWLSSAFIFKFAGVDVTTQNFHSFRFVTIILGLCLLFLSALFYVASHFIKEKERISKFIRCKVCGRKIPFDMVMCPYCFSDIRERKNELKEEVSGESV